MSEVIEITVQYVNPPREGKKRGNIKSSEGMTFWCLPAFLHQFSVGEICKIEFTTNEQGFNQLTKKIWTGDNKKYTPPSSKPIITRQRMDPADALGAFTTKAFEAFTLAGKVPLNRDAISTALDEITAGYHQHHSPRTKYEEILNDQIPTWDPPKSENPVDV